MAIITKRYRVEGVVQGVWFRDFVTKEARALQLTGTVTNLEDGTVGVIAQGDSAVFTTFEEKLNAGSPLATVTSVTATTLTGWTTQYFDFKQRSLGASETQSTQ